MGEINVKSYCDGLQVLEDHARPVLSLVVAEGMLFSGSYDFTIKVRQSAIMTVTDV